MIKHFGVVQNSRGDVEPGARVRVTITQTGAVANLYEDDESTAKANPIVADSQGRFEFKAQPGEYTLTTTKGGTTVTQTGLKLIGPKVPVELTVSGEPTSQAVPLARPIMKGETADVVVTVGGFRWPQSLVSVAGDRESVTLNTDELNVLIDGDVIRVEYHPQN